MYRCFLAVESVATIARAGLFFSNISLNFSCILRFRLLFSNRCLQWFGQVTFVRRNPRNCFVGSVGAGTEI